MPGGGEGLNFICDNISVNGQGHLCFAGLDTVALAGEYGTPLYLFDEDRIRHNCRVYTGAFAKYFPEGSMPVYASKAGCFKELLRIVSDEGFGFDLVSPGEIYTAAHSGVSLENAFFHSNDKTDADIRYAMDCGTGYFVIESGDEAMAVDAAAREKGIVQKAMLRLTPGIDTHTYAAMNTGLVDSKFGVAIETGQAEKLTEKILGMRNIELTGFHCHVGSSIFSEDVFERSAMIMTDFIAKMEKKYGYRCGMLNLGGGYGVRYTVDDPYLDIAEKIRSVSETIAARCARHGISVPLIQMEPGRSIVADAGMTLYTAGSIKSIPGYKNYVSVDGGMTDNPRYALYRARYTCYDASRMNERFIFPCDLVGRCCESGDIIQPGVLMSENIGRGDIIAVCTTGAYNYSMASNYNRIPRPAVVMVKDGETRLAVRRETLEDVASLDI